MRCLFAMQQFSHNDPEARLTHSSKCDLGPTLKRKTKNKTKTGSNKLKESALFPVLPFSFPQLTTRRTRNGH